MARLVVEDEEMVSWVDTDSVEVEIPVSEPVAVTVSVEPDVRVPVVVEVNVLVSCAYAPMAARRATRVVSLVNCMLIV